MSSTSVFKGEQVLAFITAGDIHGDSKKREKYREFVSRRLDQVDFINFAGDYLVTPLKDLHEASRKIASHLESFSDLSVPVTCLGGNYEPHYAVNIAVEELGGALKSTGAEKSEKLPAPGAVLNIDEFKLVGVEGSNPINGTYPGERSEEELEWALSSAISSAGRADIVLTHAPPYGFRDTLGSYGLPPHMWGKHVGSTAFRKLAEEHKPILFVSGHIHEALGLTVVDWSTGKIVLDRDISESVYRAIIIAPEDKKFTVFVSHGTLEYWNTMIVRILKSADKVAVEVTKTKSGELDSLTKLAVKLFKRKYYDDVVVVGEGAGLEDKNKH